MYSRVIVFAGPSLPSSYQHPLVELRPPAKRGDLRPYIGKTDILVVLIDGFFFHNPGLTHLEIIELLQGGSSMIGAASMGALRAAEVRMPHCIGMGAVYDALVAGFFTDDSELAVGVSPMDYSSITISLIDVRAILALQSEISPDHSELYEALRLAKGIHFLDRTRSQLARAWSHACPKIAASLVSLLSDNNHSLKRYDAQWAISAAALCVEGTLNFDSLSVYDSQRVRRSLFFDEGLKSI